MFEKTDTDHAPWHIVRSDDKRRARLNCIAHILSLIPYKKVPSEKVELPKRSNKRKYDDREVSGRAQARPSAILVRPEGSSDPCRTKPFDICQ